MHDLGMAMGGTTTISCFLDKPYLFLESTVHLHSCCIDLSSLVDRMRKLNLTPYKSGKVLFSLSLPLFPSLQTAAQISITHPSVFSYAQTQSTSAKYFASICQVCDLTSRSLASILQVCDLTSRSLASILQVHDLTSQYFASILQVHDLTSQYFSLGTKFSFLHTSTTSPELGSLPQI